MIGAALVLLQAIIYQTATIQRFQTKEKEKRREESNTDESLMCKRARTPSLLKRR